MSLLAAVSGRSWRATAVGGAAPSGTILERIDAINGGPDYHWRLAESSGTTMAARVGGITGTWVNTGDLQYGIDPLTTNAASGKCMGLGADPDNPGHGRITIGGGGISITSEHTIHQRVQLDQVAVKHVAVTTGDDDAVGHFSCEFEDDGAGGMKPRMFTCDAAGSPVIYVGNATGTVPIGQSFGIDWIQEDGTLRCRIDGVEIPLSLSFGTPPGTWAAAPTGILYVGAWSTGAAGLNGLLSELSIWNNYVFTLADSQSLTIPQTVVAARNVTLPNVTEGQGQITTSIGTSIHPEDGSTLSLIAPNAAHSTVVVQGLALQVTPGTVSSNQANTQGFRVTHAAGTADAIASYTVINAGAAASYLPYLGALYGSVWCNQNHGNDRLRNASPGDGCFFYAMKTGNIVAIQSHERIGSGYSDPAGSGNHGSYTVRIWPANATTRRPITTGSPICQKSTYNATTSASNQYPVITFDSPGAVTAGQPYFLAFARNSGGYYSHNHVWQNSFFSQTDTLTPQNYVEPGGGPGAGSINCASGGVDAENPGSSAARVRGWTPFKVGGVHRVVGRFTTQDGQYDRRCGGCYEVAFVYSDGDVAGFGSFGGGGAGADRTQPGGTSAHRILMTAANGYQVRERFRVTRANVVVSGVFIRAVRNATSTGSLRVRLESGPTTETHFPSSNGSLMEEFVVPASLILPVGNVSFETHEQLGSVTAALDVVHFVWVPVSSGNHTLAVGSQYTVRVYPEGAAQYAIQGCSRGAHIGHSPLGKTRTWAQWEADREVSGECFEDCRDGGEYSANGGASWLPLYGSSGDGVYPIVFKRV